MSRASIDGSAFDRFRALVEAASNPTLRCAIQGLLFGLYSGGADEGVTLLEREAEGRLEPAPGDRSDRGAGDDLVTDEAAR